MYKVFISSVQREFAKERKAIAAAIRKDCVLKLFFEPFLFEETVACNRSAQKVYLDEVRGCDVYLGIFGDCYGNEDAEGVSPTEREYDAATESGRYRIAFVKKTVEKLLKVHDSKPRNEVIAKAMSWTSYVEKSGSGTGDIVQKCRGWGLPEPTYMPDAVDFKTIIWRKRSVENPVDVLTPVTLTGVGDVTAVGAMPINRFEQIVWALRECPLGTIELSQKIGVPDVKNVQRRYGKVLLDDGIVEYTIPNKPNSKLQKYRLTKRGLQLLEGFTAVAGAVKGDEKGKEKSKEKSKEKIVALLAEHSEWTTEDLARETGLSRSGIEKNIRSLKKEGRLSRRGGDKGGEWIVAAP